MNKRIQELATQAEMSANKGDHVDVKQMMEKFAELIVQECDRVARENAGGKTGVALWSVQFAMDAVKRHFGVEE